MSFTITGNVVDIRNRRIYSAEIMVEQDRIIAINELNSSLEGPYIIPGFIDAHVHIESSMLIPSEFARLAVPHGTVATVSDPHEIANVCGLAGVNYMIENGKTVPFKFYFGAPSCVPATTFETAGAAIGITEIEDMMKREDIWYLSEMMNFPGVLNNDEEVLQKIAAAQKNNKPVDGHAPGLRGDLAQQYINAGISTDHECFTKEEALDKLGYGMNIIIREGSAAKNFEALIDLLHDYPNKIMFCSDDKHPDSLVEGHINLLCARAVAKGIDVFKVLQAACLNPVQHYKLKVGLLRKNDFADFVIVKDLQQFDVLQTYINGQLVAENGKTLIERQPATIINHFHCSKKTVDDFKIHAPLTTHYSLPVIEALDGQLITNKINAAPKNSNGNIVSDVANDILKIVVVNRYQDAPIAKAFIKNFGLKKGAIASSVAHDSHNIVAIGVDDESICEAVNRIIEHKGGVSVAPPPPEGGIWEDSYEYETADPMLYSLLKEFVKKHRSMPTEAENILWEQLRGKKLEGYKFRRQHIVGDFITDFICLSKKLIIEVDGLIHQLPENKLSDEERTQWLTGKGYTVIRFTNNEVIYETVKVLQHILQTLKKLPDQRRVSRIPPLGGGGALPLPVAGLMSTDDGYKVAEQYAAMDAAAKALGSTLAAPYMTLSFMALLVIPHLKLSDKGLFDGDTFQLLEQ